MPFSVILGLLSNYGFYHPHTCTFFELPKGLPQNLLFPYNNLLIVLWGINNTAMPNFTFTVHRTCPIWVATSNVLKGWPPSLYNNCISVEMVTAPILTFSIRDKDHGFESRECHVGRRIVVGALTMPLPTCMS